MDQYERFEQIGGTCGKVYKAIDKNTGKLVALKKTRIETEDEGVPSTALREASILQMLSESNHIVKLLCVEHVQERWVYMVFEWLTTDLKNFMDRTGGGPEAAPMPTMQIKSFMYQLIKGVAHCHKHGVMHRDLKPHNLLIDTEKECLKIADLSLARQFSVPIRSYTHEVVTLWYRAPEILLGCTHYAPAVDMWSCSAIFAEMVQKKPLLMGGCELEQLLYTFKLLGTPNEQLWPGMTELRDWHEFPHWEGVPLATKFPNLEPAGVDLMQQMFVYDPAKRITAKDALVHPYFDDLDKATIDLLESETVRLREGTPPY